MNKNFTIGLLVIIVLVGGYFLLTSKPTATNVTQNPPATTTGTSTPPVGDTSAPALVLSTPTVVTSSSYTASISTASVTGQVNPNGLSTTYWFEYGTTNTLGSRTVQQEIGSGYSAISSPDFITGLHSNTTYYYRLMADNNLGTVYGTTYTLKTNSAAAPKASVPTVKTMNATNVTRTAVSLNGQVNPNAFQTNYWFEYGKDTKLGNTTSITSVEDNSSTTTVSEPISGLDALTKYYFRIDAQNQFGTVIGSTLNFTTSGPANPGMPTVTTNSASSITSSAAKLNGHINSNGADTNYWFEYSTDSLLGTLIGSGTTVQTVNAGTNTVSVSANIDSLNRNTKYFYHLVGRNQYGIVNGSILSFTTGK